MGIFNKLTVTTTWTAIAGLVVDSHNDLENVGSRIIVYRHQASAPAPEDTEGKELLPNRSATLIEEAGLTYFIRMRDGGGTAFISETVDAGTPGGGAAGGLSIRESSIPLPAIGASDELPVDSTKPHCFVGVQFFDDDQGATPATPSAGTVTISVKTLNSTPVPQSPDPDVIMADAPEDISFDGNADRVKAQPAGIIGASFYKLVVTCNGS